MNKKVVLISGSFYGQAMGGAEYQLFLLGTYLKKKGYRVSYVFVDNKSPIETKYDFELFRIRKRFLLRRVLGRHFFLDYFKLKRSLTEIAPDFIIVRGGFAYAGIAAKYCTYHNCKMIWQIASRKDLERFKLVLKRTIVFDYIDKKFLGFGIRNADYIIGQAGYQDKLLFKNFNRHCALIVPNFHPLPEEKIEKKNPIKVIWIANFKELKRPELFIDLAREFSGYQDAVFVMIGKNSFSGRMKNIGAAIIQAKNIEYKGELPLHEVNRILSGSHILVNTSQIEGFPNTFIQAWMRKIPVVSLNVDPDDVIKKNKIGFHSGSFDQMVRDIQLLISDGQMREEMGERAQQFAFQNYSMRNMDKILDLIES